MARRNRKKNQAGSVFPAPLAVILAVVAGLAVFYVCLKSKTEGLGQEIKALEVRRDQLRQDIVKEQCEWARLLSPASMEQALKSHGLAMTWPGCDQVVRVKADGTIDSMGVPEMRSRSRYARVDRIVMND